VESRRLRRAAKKLLQKKPRRPRKPQPRLEVNNPQRSIIPQRRQLESQRMRLRLRRSLRKKKLYSLTSRNGKLRSRKEIS